MIRLMLATYSNKERQELATILESAQRTLANATKCHAKSKPCSLCDMRHVCTDLLSAAVFARDYTPEK